MSDFPKTSMSDFQQLGWHLQASVHPHLQASVRRPHKIMAERGAIVVNPLCIEHTENINGNLTSNGVHYPDETDLAASRQPPRRYQQLESQRVHFIWDAFAILSILTFVADITSDVVVSVLYYIDGSYLWFALTIGFVLLSSIIMQVFSAKWFHEDSEHQTWSNYLLHLFQMGPLVR